MNIEVYCDESRQQYFAHPEALSDRHYVLIGSLWIEAERRAKLKGEIRALREKHSLPGEFKWNRVSPSRQPFYMELVELFFSQPVRFRCIVLPARQMNVIQFHSGDNELMFYKFYYQLLHHWILDFNQYHIFVDAKTNRVRNRLTHLRNVLSSANLFSTIEAVQALPSHEVDLLQLVDVLIGAVGYRFHDETGSTAKAEVVRTIERRLKHRIRPTGKVEEKFNIFRWQPGGGW